MNQSRSSKRHRSKRSPALMPIQNETNYHPADLLPTSPIECSAYFLSRISLGDYAVNTLKQTVDSTVSGPKSKGLKVKLLLPDDGLIVDNVLDPDQSWMYKTTELLYIWQDFYFKNIIVVITINRSEYQETEPYSASIFRLRGHESIPLFIQRAQQFFSQLLSNTPTNDFNEFIENSPTRENTVTTVRKRKHSKKCRHHPTTTMTTTTTTKQSVIKPSPPNTKKPKTVEPPVTRTEFDPRKTTNSSFEPYKSRTHSETTVSSDTRSSNSKKATNNNNHHNDDDDDKLTTISSSIPSEYLTELLHELKELRNEIATLKLESRLTPARSASPSPMPESRENRKNKIDIALLESDAETQTDLTLINGHTKIDTSTNNNNNKRKKEPINTKVNKRTVSNNVAPEREESTLVNSSQLNNSSYEKSSSYTQAEFQPISNSKSKSKSSAVEKDLSLPVKLVVKEKDIPKVLSTNLVKAEFTPPKHTGEVVSFCASLDDTVASPENLYENLPIFVKTTPNQDFYYNTPTANKNDEQKPNKPNLYLTLTGDQNSDLQKQYLSQLFGPQNGIALLLPKQVIQNNLNVYPTSQQDTQPNNRQYLQQSLFSDHLTNPLFNVDKQLLANTIANQFGIDRKSPSLQKLIANQHLFVANKRTFANMIWQMTPEEEDAICSSPETILPNTIEVDSSSPTAKSILKPKKPSHAVSKGRISWDSTLE